MQREHKHKHKAKKLGPGISIEKFARAKSSGYDKKAVQEKERALNAKKVNKYKKLKQRLKDKLQPPARFTAVRLANDLLVGTGAHPSGGCKYVCEAFWGSPHVFHYTSKLSHTLYDLL